jgi:radical SAM protein with 4Fe4S-binding SPASM domain
MHFYWKVLSRITAKRCFNALLVLGSYYFSRLFKTQPVGLPISLSIEPTTSCNLGCPECPSGLKQFSRPTGNLKSEQLYNWLNPIVDQLWYVNFYFQGEPFIHKEILNQIAFVSKQGVFTSTSTNAHFITKEIAEKIIASGLDQLIISIDGTTQETYEKYRIHGKLEKVLEGTANIIEAKRNLQSSTPHVVFQFLVVAHNEHQIEDAKQLAKEYDVNEIRFKTAQVYNYENGNDLIPKNDKYSRYKQLKSGKWVVKNKLENHCWRMWSGSVITWDGKVVPCCFDKDAKHQLGDLTVSSFRSIWKSTSYMQFRKKVMSNRSQIDICTNCTEGTQVWS